MGTKAFLQKGRTKPGIVLPANAVAKVNEASDRSGLIRAAEHAMQPAEPPPVKTVEVAAAASVEVTSQASLSVTPETKPEFVPVTGEDIDRLLGVTAEEKKLAQSLKPTTIPADTPVTMIAGIGTTLAERLSKYGFRTMGELAAADANMLNEIPGVRNRGRQWVDEARKRLGMS